MLSEVVNLKNQQYEEFTINYKFSYLADEQINISVDELKRFIYSTPEVEYTFSFFYVSKNVKCTATIVTFKENLNKSFFEKIYCIFERVIVFENDRYIKIQVGGVNSKSVDLFDMHIADKAVHRLLMEGNISDDISEYALYKYISAGIADERLKTPFCKYLEKISGLITDPLMLNAFIDIDVAENVLDSIFVRNVFSEIYCMKNGGEIRHLYLYR